MRTRPTVAGTALAVACVGGAAVAWLLGLPELSALAAAGLAAIGAAVVALRGAGRGLRVQRSARPARLHVGGGCTLSLSLTNGGGRRTPLLELHDRIDGAVRPPLLVAPLDPREGCVAAHPMPTDRRGVHHAGPLTVVASDALGLARRSVEVPGRTAVVVLPRVWALSVLPEAPGDEPEHGTRALTSSSTVDEEFASLRDYVEGDDIRRIHWPSTARRGAPVVRQFDVPWQRRSIVVLDRRAGHDADAFERAVSAAASVVDLAASEDELVRFVTTSGEDTGLVPAAEHLDDLMDRLAVVAPEAADRRRPDPLLGTLGRLGARGVGLVVVCTAAVTAAEAVATEQRARGIGRLVVVHCAPPGAATVAARTATVLRWDGTTGLDEVWSRVPWRDAHAGAVR